MSDNPEVICYVRSTQLSVARFYGRCQFNGDLYHYNPAADTLTRADVLKKRKEWQVIVDTDGKYEVIGTYPTRAKAMKAAKADLRDACLFGPDGLDYAPLKAKLAQK